jgi:hypothetical protein
VSGLSLVFGSDFPYFSPKTENSSSRVRVCCGVSPFKRALPTIENRKEYRRRNFRRFGLTPPLWRSNDLHPERQAHQPDYHDDTELALWRGGRRGRQDIRHDTERRRRANRDSYDLYCERKAEHPNDYRAERPLRCSRPLTPTRVGSVTFRPEASAQQARTCAASGSTSSWPATSARRSRRFWSRRFYLYGGDVTTTESDAATTSAQHRLTVMRAADHR